MKKLLSLAAACLMATAALADGDYNYLTFTRADQTEQSFAASGLVITFNGGNAVVTPQGGTPTTFTVADLVKMRFTAVPAAIDGVTTSEKATPLTAYTVAGQLVGSFRSKADMEGALQKGIYVVRQNGKSYKVTVK